MRIVMNNYLLLPLSIMLIISIACTQQVDRHEQNKSLVISANNELLSNGNISFADTVFAEDYRNNGSEMGIEPIKNFASTLLNTFPDLQVTVEPILAEGDLVGWLRTRHPRGRDHGYSCHRPTNNLAVNCNYSYR